MIIDINKKMLNSIVKQSLLQISIELYNSGQNSFMKMSEYFNLYHFNYNSLNDRKINQLVDLMKKKHKHSGKLSFYPSMKKKNFLIRSLALAKPRMGCHNLHVETGR